MGSVREVDDFDLILFKFVFRIGLKCGQSNTGSINIIVCPAVVERAESVLGTKKRTIELVVYFESYQHEGNSNCRGPKACLHIAPQVLFRVRVDRMDIQHSLDKG